MEGNTAPRILVSAPFTVVANTLMSTSSSPGVGFAISLNSRTPGDPYFVHIIALISIPSRLV